MEKFTLFNNKYHPIRFIFWIFATKTHHLEAEKGLLNCKMQPRSRVLSKKWFFDAFRADNCALVVEQFWFWI